MNAINVFIVFASVSHITYYNTSNIEGDMDEFVTHKTMTTANSIQLYWPDAICKNVIR